MILLGRGRDCTELFEGVHALKGGKAHKLLAKYEGSKSHKAFGW